LSLKVSVRRTSKVVFVADAARAWSWTANRDIRHHLIAVPDLSALRELSVGPWSHDTLRLWLTVEDRDSLLPDWLNNERDTLLAATGGWEEALHAIFTNPQILDRCTADELASRLQQLNSSNGDLFDDIAVLPDAVRMLSAVAQAEDLRAPDEQVDIDLIVEAGDGLDPEATGHGLDWAELVGAVAHGPDGIILNKLLRGALPRLRSAIAE
jgi:hypothetical protein